MYRLLTQYGVRSRSVASFLEILALEKSTWKDEKDTLFQILRRGVEVMIGYFANTSDIQLKDECRKTLVQVLRREKFKSIINNLSKSDRSVMQAINADYVQDKVDRSTYAGIDDTEDLPPIIREAKIKLKFGKPVAIDASAIGGGLMSDEKADGDHLSEYRLYLDNGNMEFFQAYKSKIFGFISRQTFEDSFKLTADWKVRFYALEEIYIQMSGIDKLKDDQLWNMTKFVYVQLNCGIRIEFLDAAKHERRLKLSIKDFRDGFDAVGRLLTQLPGAGQGIRHRRPIIRVDDSAAGYPQGRRESMNAAKIDIVLMLMANRLVSYRSTLLIEPLVRLLCIDTVSVRRLAFDVLANIGKSYRSKLVSLLQVYLTALKYPNWQLRVNVLNLISLLLSQSSSSISSIRPSDIVSSLMSMLDDDCSRVKQYIDVTRSTVDALVIVGRLWSERLMQESMTDKVDAKVMDYIIDRIDDVSYDPIAKMNVYIESTDNRDNDFVKDIIEKERKFNKSMHAKVDGIDVIGVRISSNDGNRQSIDRSTDRSVNKMTDSIDKSMTDNRQSINRSINDKTDRSVKKAEAFIVDGGKIERPARELKSKLRLDKGQDLRDRLKKDHASLVMSLDASQYSDYRGKDNGFKLTADKPKLTAEQMMTNALNDYMTDRQQYDGKFNDNDDNEDKRNYGDYKKIFEVPKDAEVFERYRKKAEADKMKENQAKLWKKPEVEVNEPVPCIAFDHLRPLDDADQFVKDFSSIMDGNHD